MLLKVHKIKNIQHLNDFYLFLENHFAFISGFAFSLSHYTSFKNFTEHREHDYGQSFFVTAPDYDLVQHLK